MRIIYVTACLPHGTDEAFILPEIRQLIRSGHEVLVVPRSARGPIVHGHELLERARREALCSKRVLKAAAGVALAAPAKTAKALRTLLASRSLAVTVKNLAVVPKALWLADVAARWKAGHMHCHWGGTTATMTLLASRISGIPWSLTMHRWDIVENNLLAEKAGSASLARFISRDGLRMARAAGIQAGANVRVLPMGVALPRKIERPARLKPVVLCPARLVEVKGHRYLLEAWRILKNRDVEGELWLAGHGELRTQLESLTDDLGLRASVKFLGAVPHDVLLEVYERPVVAVVVLASVDLGKGYHEGIPVALVEAMSYGIPVIATDTGGTAELIAPGNGLLVPPGDSTALANALALLLQSSELRKQYGDCGRQRVSQDHDIVRVAAELESAFAAAGERPAAAHQCV
jgi:colanic acid/amylovoran biosynthesis glycosyltransferase